MKKFNFVAGMSTALLAASINTASALEFGLFSDVSLSSNDAPGENAGFALGGLDFFATTNIGESTRVFIEYVFEDPGDGLITDLERLWIARDISDELSIGVGRFHTPLGYWNRTYHHGAILQDTVSRPFFLEFEDGDAAVLPVHVVGVMASGTFSLTSSDVSYEFYIGNGPSLDTNTAPDKPEIEINVSGDLNQDKSVGLRVTYALDDTPLTVGLMMMNNVVAESSATGTTSAAEGEDLVAQTITGFDLRFDGDYFDLLVEYYNFDNEGKVVSNLESHSGSAYFAQLGYKINDTNKLIYRYANLDFDANDLYFNILGAEEASHQVIAYRHDLDATNSLKLEINKNDPEATGTESDTTVTLQWAFMVF